MNIEKLTQVEETAFKAIVAVAREQARPEADKIKEQRVKTEAPKLAKRRKVSVDEAKKIILSRSNGDLMSDDEIIFQDSGRISVADILSDPEKYVGCSCADPLEPEEGTSRAILLRGDKDKRLFISSRLHGGQYFFLKPDILGDVIRELSAEEATHKIDSPLPLVKKNEQSQPFPFESLGPTMAAACKAIQENVQAPDAIIAQSVLGAANLAVQGLGNIIIDGRVFPVSLFLLSIAGTGERKSAVDSLTLSRHREIEKGEISKLAGEQGLYEINNAAFEHERSVLIKDKKKSLQEKQAGLEMLQGQEPVKPLDQTLLVTDFTFEGLFKLFQVGIASKGLFADEGGQVTGGHGMKKESILATAAGLSKFWDGARVDRIRVLDGFSHLYGRRLSVHLMMQETVGLNFYTNDILTDQGLISRFLAAWPTSTVGSRAYVPVNIKDSAPMVCFYEKVSTAMSRKLQYKEDSNGRELDPPCLPLSPEAKHLWKDCYNEIESESGPKKMLAPIRGLANKAAEHAARIAGTIQLFEDPTATEIKAEAMRFGISATEWYLDEALRIAGSFSPERYLLKAKEVIRWIHENSFRIVALPDIYQYSPVRSASQARKVVDILKSHNHLMEPVIGKGGDKEPVKTRGGKYSRECWDVHPESKGCFIED